MKGKREGRKMGEMCRGDKRIFRIYKRKDEGSEEGEEDIKRMSRIYERKEGG